MNADLKGVCFMGKALDSILSLAKGYENGIHLVSGDNVNIDKLICRDAYYDILRTVNSGEYLGHAICIVGLRRTGKSTILKQIHNNHNDFGFREEEILHLTISCISSGRSIDRDSMNSDKISGLNKISFPTLNEVKSFIDNYRKDKSIKCILIDEITLCEDFILCGKGFVDSIVDSGIVLILAGTESVSFNLASCNSLYSRLILFDVSYIPFGEYCKLKSLPVNSIENKRESLYKYIQHGNILDDTVDVSYKYLESALGINVALSILNADLPEFVGCESNVKSLVEMIIKYFRLLGEQIDIDKIKDSINRANLSKAYNNINRRRIANDLDTINLSKGNRKSIVIKAAEDIFSSYSLKFDLSNISLTIEQLYAIDKLFVNMGILYNLSVIPSVERGSAEHMEDLNILHALAYNFLESISDTIMSSNLGLSDDEVNELANEVKSTVTGDIIESIITIQFIKQLEKDSKLLTGLTRYQDVLFTPERKCTKRKMYKYRKKIFENGESTTAEIDLVLNLSDRIDLVEIKKSDKIAEEQTRWLRNNEVIEDIKEIISNSKPINKFVYYLGESAIVGDIQYVNITEVLLNHYKLYFERIEYL